ncbi:hypothetical protein FDW83_17060 [Pseudarthrobacter sp. NamE2]|uniref:hypothetical protein n=1 Tax=Pseudarthrobacter sp. NamE2 TaxID=2576838 RepID=UPI0010FF5079|nr:hypothetical protein [Pseudarthrobacter sp. NamE2]TLM81205.1 hypothetical protein FDW83_17060 [Pseudarthrobacter sp. NamE2]
MDTIPAMILIFGAALVWIGLTVFAVLRLRRRWNGSSLVASAPAKAATGPNRFHGPWRRQGRLTGQARRRHRRLRLRRVRG